MADIKKSAFESGFFVRKDELFHAEAIDGFGGEHLASLKHDAREVFVVHRVRKVLRL